MALYREEDLTRIEEAKRQWEETVLKRNLERLGLGESPVRLNTPLDLRDHDYLEKVGFPGQYPFTRGTYAVPLAATPYGASTTERDVTVRAGVYAGYGTVEDTRDLWRAQRRRGANVAFDLPTQCGYDSDHPLAEGEVGKVGIAVDTLADMETLYEAFDGTCTLDQMASNFTINAPCNVILAMYLAIAEKKGVPLDKLRGTPQNDILKEFIARGTYIFPPEPSIRMVRDTITFCHKYAPNVNAISICAFHISEAGADPVQTAAFFLSNAITYVKLGIDAGLDVDRFLRQFTFLPYGVSMDFWLEIAKVRATRRIWARIMKERFGAKDPRSCIMRGMETSIVGNVNYTLQRPLNNLVRGALGGIMSYLANGYGTAGTPWDEVFGLGHSYESTQMHRDATRILQLEARLGQVVDPLAGSYFVESLTDEVEEKVWQEMRKIEELGGAVEAIKAGYMQREIAKSASRFQRELETGQRIIVGVNKFTGEGELEVVPPITCHPYDPKKLESAYERQLAKLKRIKAERNNTLVQECLREIYEAAKRDNENLIPYFMKAIKAHAALGEICGVLRQVFGEWEPPGL